MLGEEVQFPQEIIIYNYELKRTGMQAWNRQGKQSIAC
jgi:hypothetical protein